MYALSPIGTIKTPILTKENAPIQSSRSELTGKVIVKDEFREGLIGIEEFSHIYLFYWFDRASDAVSMKVKPFLDDRERGLFATRYPCRPNQIGFSIVEVLFCQGNEIVFRGADMLNDTPLLDIKPYIPEFDIFQATKTGWYQKRARK